jgi:hypothetical protein
MGLFSRKKKKYAPSAYQAPAGWKRIHAGGDAAINVPESWEVEHGEKLVVEDRENGIRAKVTLYQIPADNNPDLDDVFKGMLDNWREYFAEAGPVESGNSYRCIRMNTDETVLHVMGLSMARIGDYYIAAYIMFTFFEAEVYDQHKAAFHGVLSGLGPMI